MRNSLIAVTCLLASAGRPALAQYRVTGVAAGWSSYYYNYPEGGGFVPTGSDIHVVQNSTAYGTTDSTGLATAITGTAFGNPPPDGSGQRIETFSKQQIAVSLPFASISTSSIDTGVNGIYTGSDGGVANGHWEDRLTFNVAGAGPGTQTTIHVNLIQTGHMVRTGSDTVGAEGGITLLTFQFGAVGVTTDIELHGNISPNAYINSIGQVGGSFTTQSVNQISYSGDITITGPSQSVPIYLDLQTSSRNGLDTFYTASISLGLPDGTTFSSDSGQFASNVCALPGDMNLDGRVDGSDIQPFVNCVLGVNGSNCGCADMNIDGVVDNTLDVARFLAALLN